MEFPGGKLEIGESEEEALHREIKEELACDIVIKRHFFQNSYQYPDFIVFLSFFLCELKSPPIASEGQEIRWISVEELDENEFLPADRLVLQRLRACKGE